MARPATFLHPFVFFSTPLPPSPFPLLPPPAMFFFFTSLHVWADPTSLISLWRCPPLSVMIKQSGSASEGYRTPVCRTVPPTPYPPSLSPFPLTPCPPLQQSACLLIVSAFFKKRKKENYIKKQKQAAIRMFTEYTLAKLEMRSHHHRITAVSPGDPFPSLPLSSSFFPARYGEVCSIAQWNTQTKRWVDGGVQEATCCCLFGSGPPAQLFICRPRYPLGPLSALPLVEA